MLIDVKRFSKNASHGVGWTRCEAATAAWAFFSNDVKMHKVLAYMSLASAIYVIFKFVMKEAKCAGQCISCGFAEPASRA